MWSWEIGFGLLLELDFIILNGCGRMGIRNRPKLFGFSLLFLRFKVGYTHLSLLLSSFFLIIEDKTKAQKGQTHKSIYTHIYITI